MPHFSILTRCIKALLLLLLLLQLSASDTYSRLSQPSDWSAILNQVRDIGKDKHRRHRSYDKIGRSMRECMLTLNKSAFSPAMLGVTEPVALRSRACVRATTWGHIKGELFQNDQAATSGSLLFVIAAFVRNDDNARILGLSLGSVQAFHPTAEILVVDNGSPAKGLLVNAVDECKRNWSGAVNIVTARSNRALDKNESDAIIHKTMMTLEYADTIAMPPTREIGALRAAILFIERRCRTKGITPPRYVAFLLHSTGLRMPLPMGELVALVKNETCLSFALDVPWFRYEPMGGRFVESRYGLDNRLTVRST